MSLRRRITPGGMRPSQLAELERARKREILAQPLPGTASDDHPRTQKQQCVQQTTPFYELPAEIRNRVYDLAMPSKERGDEILVASPAWDSCMISAVQPSITRASRQTRAESLKMFYASNDFHAYVEYYDFRQLVRWARCVASMKSPPRLQVEVYMLHEMSCHSGLVAFAGAWCRLARHEPFHLVLHTRFTPPRAGKAQCEKVVFAVEAAEQRDPLMPLPLSPRLHQKLGFLGDCMCLCGMIDIDAYGVCSKEKQVSYDGLAGR